MHRENRVGAWKAKKEVWWFGVSEKGRQKKKGEKTVVWGAQRVESPSRQRRMARSLQRLQQSLFPRLPRFLSSAGARSGSYGGVFAPAVRTAALSFAFHLGLAELYDWRQSNSRHLARRLYETVSRHKHTSIGVW